MNADKILPILCRYLKDTDNRLLARWKPFKNGQFYESGPIACKSFGKNGLDIL